VAEMKSAPPMKVYQQHGDDTKEKHYGKGSTFMEKFQSLVTGGASGTLKKAAGK